MNKKSQVTVKRVLRVDGNSDPHEEIKSTGNENYIGK